MIARTFSTTHHGECDKLGLAIQLEIFANDYWVPAHLDHEQAARFVFEQFKRMIQ
jgi:hypothetical protein